MPVPPCMVRTCTSILTLAESSEEPLVYHPDSFTPHHLQALPTSAPSEVLGVPQQEQS